MAVELTPELLAQIRARLARSRVPVFGARSKAAGTYTDMCALIDATFFNRYPGSDVVAAIRYDANCGPWSQSAQDMASNQAVQDVLSLLGAVRRSDLPASQRVAPHKVSTPRNPERSGLAGGPIPAGAKEYVPPPNPRPAFLPPIEQGDAPPPGGSKKIIPPPPRQSEPPPPSGSQRKEKPVARNVPLGGGAEPQRLLGLPDSLNPAKAGPCDYAKNVNTMMEKAREKGWAAIALAVGQGHFVYSEAGQSGPWMVPMCRGFGKIDIGAFDEPWAGQVTESQAVTGTAITRPTGGGQLIPNPGGGGMTGQAPEGFPDGVPPNIVQVRRCPGPMRLAYWGLCYHKSILPRSLRMNKPKKAPVSWSDANSIRKGRTASKRIQRYAKRDERESRRMFPRRRK